MGVGHPGMGSRLRQLVRTGLGGVYVLKMVRETEAGLPVARAEIPRELAVRRQRGQTVEKSHRISGPRLGVNRGLGRKMILETHVQAVPWSGRDGESRMIGNEAFQVRL